MNTDENKTTGNTTNFDGSTQSNSGNIDQNVSGENQKLDNLDIDLNLDGLDLPIEKKEEGDTINPSNFGEKINDLDLGNLLNNDFKNQSSDFENQEIELNIPNIAVDAIENNSQELNQNEIKKVPLQEDVQEDVQEDNNINISNDLLDTPNKESDYVKLNDLDLSTIDDNILSGNSNHTDLSIENNSDLIESDGQIDYDDKNNLPQGPHDKNVSEKLDDIVQEGLDLGATKKEENYSNSLYSDSEGQTKEKVAEGQLENIDSLNLENDWLLEEDKKVEEHLKETKDLDDTKLEVNETALIDQDKKDLDDLESLDIPFFSGDDKKTDDQVYNQNQKDGIESFDQNNVSYNQATNNNDIDLEQLGKLDLNHNQGFDLQKSGLKTDNNDGSVVENSQGDIVSDTGEFVGNIGSYIPNEEDFNKTSQLLSSAGKGVLDLSELEKKIDPDLANIGNNKNIGVNNYSTEINLDQIVSNFQQKNNIQENQENDHDHQNVVLENSNLSTKIDKDIKKDPDINFKINMDDKNQNLMTNNNDIVILSEEEANKILHRKKKHTGLKVFLLLILLIFGGVFVLSKMYPQEFDDILSSIRGVNESKIEYSDNSDINVQLIENEMDGVDDEQEIDPDSLAGQLVENDMDEQLGLNENLDLDEQINLDENIDLNQDQPLNQQESLDHNSGGDGFDAFEAIDNVIDSNDSILNNAQFLEKLYNYKAQGEDFNNWGRNLGNSTAMKYGLYISKNSDSFINDIESGVEIDTNSLNKHFTQFDVYLEKLNELRITIDAEQTLQEVSGTNDTDPTSTEQ